MKLTKYFALAGIAAALTLSSCDLFAPAPTPGPADATVPTGYEVVYVDTTTLTGGAAAGGSVARLHFHTNLRTNGVLKIDEVFGYDTQEYKEDRTPVSTFEADEPTSNYWDRSFSGSASDTVNPGYLTFTVTDDGGTDAYVYSGTLASPGLAKKYIGLVVDTAGWDTFKNATNVAAIRVEFKDANDADFLGDTAEDITTLFTAAP